MGYMKQLDIRIRNGGDDAIAAVSELMPQWISVSERLPNHREWVLVCHDAPNKSAEIGKLVGEFTWELKSPVGGWTTSLISHWMPLPAPPTDDK